jgi:hypothetical protein
MTGDMDEEVGGDNDEEENALDALVAWWDRHCENAGSRRMGFQLRTLCDYLGGDVEGSRGLSNS